MVVLPRAKDEPRRPPVPIGGPGLHSKPIARLQLRSPPWIEWWELDSIIGQSDRSVMALVLPWDSCCFYSKRIRENKIISEENFGCSDFPAHSEPPFCSPLALRLFTAREGRLTSLPAFLSRPAQRWSRPRVGLLRIVKPTRRAAFYIADEYRGIWEAEGAVGVWAVVV